MVRLQSKHYIPDAAIEALLKFLCALFVVLGRFSNLASEISEILPQTLYTMRKTIGYNDDFQKYVICPTCHRVYEYKQCVSKCGSQESTKFCTHVKFPRHRYRSGRAPCNAPLLRSVTLYTGKKFLYPFKIYCYRKLAVSLQELLLRPGFFDACQLWKQQATTTDYNDLYGGRIWKDFQYFNGEQFLALSTGIGLTLNIDWFQPFSHTVYSVGVIYLVIMNLPRSIRFKRENIMIAGILPGPSEPKHDINSYLTPLVKELNDLWAGINMSVCIGTTTVTKKIKCAILCCSCDLPAGRKVCGFLGHSASLGCSKCSKSFSGTVGSMNYSGFERSNWISRTNDQHRRNIKTIRAATSKTRQEELESELGCRYSTLLELPYFDPPRMLAIDPMHNLFLGTAKHMLSIWLDHGILSRSDFHKIQQFVDSMEVPSDIGRIPRKIESGFSGFTADQLKNWVSIYSIPALNELLPSQHLECWRHFVLACRIVCKQSLSNHDITLMDILLIEFCKKVQQLYGDRSITPNMHLHGHLIEIIKDFGPVYEFWLFSFERYNGILGNQPHNNRLIEPQLFRRFLRDNFAYGSALPATFSDDFQSLMPQVHSVGTLRDTDLSPYDYSNCILGKKCTLATLTKDETSMIRLLYAKIYSSCPDDITICSTFHKYTSCTLKSYMYHMQFRKPCVAFASWNVDLFGPSPTPLPNQNHPSANKRPVNIHYIAKVNVYTNEIVSSFTVAYVSWPQPHPNREVLGKPAEVWCYNLCESFGIHSFLPIHNIHSRCAIGRTKINNETVQIIVPLIDT